MKFKILTICLIIINSSISYAKNLEQSLNDNQSTKIQGLGKNPSKSEIEKYTEEELKKSGLNDKEINEMVRCETIVEISREMGERITNRINTLKTQSQCFIQMLKHTFTQNG